MILETIAFRRRDGHPVPPGGPTPVALGWATANVLCDGDEVIGRVRSNPWVGVGPGLVLFACATRPAVPATGSEPPIVSGLSSVSPAEDLEAALRQAEHALEHGALPRAVAQFGIVLAAEPPAPLVRQALLGLAAANERMVDCEAAILAHRLFLERFPADEEVPHILMRRGACEAELGAWEPSAQSYRQARAVGRLLPSTQVEALAREGFALFHLERFEEAEGVLAKANEVFEAAQEANLERFASFYFVGMARFYRAAILHRRFRDVSIELPESVMAKAYQTKLDLLVAAQDAYNDTIRAKHVFWVSAAGYQLGRLFGEFYDAVMYAPVPKWLNGAQRRIYFEELKKQLDPVIEKAVWVFEKNLETARRLGYENEFTQRTVDKLAHLRTVLLSNHVTLGRPHPRLMPEVETEGDEDQDPRAFEDGPSLSGLDRKLFVPGITNL